MNSNIIWQARYDLGKAIKANFLDSNFIWTDVCVPISKLSDCIEMAKKLANRKGLRSPLFGHIGDGNFHMGISANGTSQLKTAREIHHKIVEYALFQDGTCTGPCVSTYPHTANV